MSGLASVSVRKKVNQSVQLDNKNQCVCLTCIPEMTNCDSFIGRHVKAWENAIPTK